MRVRHRADGVKCKVHRNIVSQASQCNESLQYGGRQHVGVVMTTRHKRGGEPRGGLHAAQFAHPLEDAVAAIKLQAPLHVRLIGTDRRVERGARAE